MKKLLTLLLTLLMVFSLVGCNLKQEEAPTTDNEPQTEEPVIVGGYIEAEDKNLTPELIEMFEEAFEGFTGASYTPIMLEATQVVAGTNYKFRADGTKTTSPLVQGTYYVYINKDLDGNISLLDIEVIEEHEIKEFKPEVELDNELKQDITNMSFWVVFYDQYGNELQRETLKYGTIPSFKGTYPIGFKSWDKSLSAINGNTYIHALCNEQKHKSNNPTPTPVIDKYNVTVQVQGDYGTVTVKIKNGGAISKAAKGDNLVFTATANDGYAFDYWEVVSGSINIEATKSNNPINVIMPDTALTLKAHFKVNKFNIIVEADGHGTTTANPASASPGTSVSLSSSPNEGYAFKNWQIIRGLQAGDITNNSFTMPNNEVKLKAIFEKEYTIEVVSQGHGTASASETKGVTNKEITLTVTPEEGYKLDQFVVERGGVSIDENNKFKVGTKNIKIKAIFVLDALNIIVEDDGHGTATANPTSAPPGTSVSLSSSPNEGYAFKNWQIIRGLQAGDITNNSFTMPNNEVKLKAIFERVYNINIQTNEHGSVTSKIGDNAVTSAPNNAEITLVATPEEGYKFKEWKVVSGSVTITNNKFTMPANNVTIMAIFEQKEPGEEPNATYVVSLYMLENTSGHIAVFGPATSSSYNGISKGHNETHTHCINTDSWEEINHNIIEGHSDYYSDCITNGCTKEIPLVLNETIFSGTAAENPSSVLYYSIKQTYQKYNDSYDSTNCESTNWATSRIRATLNGHDDFASPDYAGDNCLDSENCLFSCFPKELQNLIVPRTYKVVTGWNKTSPYSIQNYTEVTDKLWLASAEEIFSNVDNEYKEEFSTIFTSKVGIEASDNKAYNEKGMPATWLLRSPCRKYYYYVTNVNNSGQPTQTPSNNQVGLAPCFLIGQIYD